MAVYNKKDFENFLNKEKIEKEKKKKKVLKIISIVLSCFLIAGIAFLIFSREENYYKEDNVTKSINYALEQFATVKPVSHDDYPRLSLQYNDVYNIPEDDEENKENNKKEPQEDKKEPTDQPTEDPPSDKTDGSYEIIFTNMESPTHSQNALVNESLYNNTYKESNDIQYIENNNITNINQNNNTYYNDRLVNDIILNNNKYGNIDHITLENTQEETNKSTEDKDTTSEETSSNEEETINPNPSEYEYFLQIAGKGTYPGYEVSGQNYIKAIQKEVCLAIKAYTTMPLASDSYRLKFTDDEYDYVYFFLIGEVRKVKKSYLSRLEDDASKNVLSLESFWVSLTEYKGSKTATKILTSGDKTFSVIANDGKHGSVENAEISLSSGSYFESYVVPKDCFVIFRDVPNGACKINIRKSGYIDFPSEIGYKEITDTYTVKENNFYEGDFPTTAVNINLRETSEGKISFAFATYDYDINKKSMSVGKENIEGYYNVDFYNQKTKETNRYSMKFENDKELYLCNIIDDLPSGKYNITVHPTNEKLEELNLKDLYINEYGISDTEYLKETEEYIFSFKSDNKVDLKIDISDDSFGGLVNRKDMLAKYQLIETNVFSKHTPKIKIVNSKGEEIFADLTEVEGRWVGAIKADRETIYDIYLSTIYGDILIYEQLNTRRSDFNFIGSFREEIAGKCKAKLQVNCGGKKVTLINAFDGEEFELKYDESVGGFVLDENTILNVGYHYLKIYDSSDNIDNVFLLMVSTASNNYILNVGN